MATIVYLDADDEITSAATRIRNAGGVRVGLVLPFGSRVATSRINFRLLAREAQANGRRLDIVAPDASARALAAAAGLPVFASVGEYEAALDAPAAADGDVPPPADGTTTPAGSSAGSSAGTSASKAAVAGAGPVPPAPGTGRAASAARPQEPRTVVAKPDDERRAELDEIVARSRQTPVARPHRRGPGAGVIAGIAVLVLALAVSGVAAALLLPSAEITVTPRIEPVGPISLTVTADPAATAVDPAAHVIPAQTVEIPVAVSGDFAATGRRVEETKATGKVRFDSINTIGPVGVPRGTRVASLDGVLFVTDEYVVVPRAKVTGNRIERGIASVSVTALKPGPGGNVDAGTITQGPGFLSTQQVAVTNPAATSGGTRTEFKRVDQEDVDGALSSLEAEIVAQFTVELENPDHVPPGATLFPATAIAGQAVPTTDPAKLVGQEVDSFTLGLTATGTVLAVDASPVRTIAEAGLAAAVDPGYKLIAGSTRVEVGEGTVTEGLIDFAVTASARQLRPLDAAALEHQVLGMSEPEARAALGAYGEVSMTLWPGWVTSVPTLDQRVTLTLAPPVDTTPEPTPRPSVRPSATPAATAEPASEGSG